MRGLVKNLDKSAAHASCDAFCPHRLGATAVAALIACCKRCMRLQFHQAVQRVRHFLGQTSRQPLNALVQDYDRTFRPSEPPASRQSISKQSNPFRNNRSAPSPFPTARRPITPTTNNKDDPAIPARPPDLALCDRSTLRIRVTTTILPVNRASHLAIYTWLAPCRDPPFLHQPPSIPAPAHAK